MPVPWDAFDALRAGLGEDDLPPFRPDWGRDMCDEFCTIPGRKPWACTRPAGHDGVHQAGSSSLRVLAEWSS